MFLLILLKVRKCPKRDMKPFSKFWEKGLSSLCNHHHHLIFLSFSNWRTFIFSFPILFTFVLSTVFRYFLGILLFFLRFPFFLAHTDFLLFTLHSVFFFRCCCCCLLWMLLFPPIRSIFSLNLIFLLALRLNAHYFWENLHTPNKKTERIINNFGTIIELFFVFFSFIFYNFLKKNEIKVRN
jgi:hypothetical protein